MLYVKISQINGRGNLAKLSIYFDSRSIEDVEYHPGGWFDNEVGRVYPHLKFGNDEDATAFVLRYGGEISATIPTEKE